MLASSGGCSHGPATGQLSAAPPRDEGGGGGVKHGDRVRPDGTADDEPSYGHVHKRPRVEAAGHAFAASRPGNGSCHQEGQVQPASQTGQPFQSPWGLPPGAGKTLHPASGDAMHVVTAAPTAGVHSGARSHPQPPSFTTGSPAVGGDSNHMPHASGTPDTPVMLAPPPPPLGPRHAHSSGHSDQPTAAAGAAVSAAEHAASLGGTASVGHATAEGASPGGSCSAAGDAGAAVSEVTAACAGKPGQGRTPMAPPCAGVPIPLPPITTGLPEQPPAQQAQHASRHSVAGAAPCGASTGGAAGKGSPCKPPSGPPEPSPGSAHSQRTGGCFDYASMWKVAGDSLELPPHSACPSPAAPGLAGGAGPRGMSSGGASGLLQGLASMPLHHQLSNVITTGNSIERGLQLLVQAGSGKLGSPGSAGGAGAGGPALGSPGSKAGHSRRLSLGFSPDLARACTALGVSGGGAAGGSSGSGPAAAGSGSGQRQSGEALHAPSASWPPQGPSALAASPRRAAAAEPASVAPGREDRCRAGSTADEADAAAALLRLPSPVRRRTAPNAVTTGASPLPGDRCTVGGAGGDRGVGGAGPGGALADPGARLSPQRQSPMCGRGDSPRRPRLARLFAQSYELLRRGRDGEADTPTAVDATDDAVSSCGSRGPMSPDGAPSVMAPPPPPAAQPTPLPQSEPQPLQGMSTPRRQELSFQTPAPAIHPPTVGAAPPPTDLHLYLTGSALANLLSTPFTPTSVPPPPMLLSHTGMLRGVGATGEPAARTTDAPAPGDTGTSAEEPPPCNPWSAPRAGRRISASSPFTLPPSALTGVGAIASGSAGGWWASAAAGSTAEPQGAWDRAAMPTPPPMGYVLPTPPHAGSAAQPGTQSQVLLPPAQQEQGSGGEQARGQGSAGQEELAQRKSHPAESGHAAAPSNAAEAASGQAMQPRGLAPQRARRHPPPSRPPAQVALPPLSTRACGLNPAAPPAQGNTASGPAALPVGTQAAATPAQRATDAATLVSPPPPGPGQGTPPFPWSIGLSPLPPLQGVPLGSGGQAAATRTTVRTPPSGGRLTASYWDEMEPTYGSTPGSTEPPSLGAAQLQPRISPPSPLRPPGSAAPALAPPPQPAAVPQSGQVEQHTQNYPAACYPQPPAPASAPAAVYAPQPQAQPPAQPPQPTGAVVHPALPTSGGYWQQLAPAHVGSMAFAPAAAPQWPAPGAGPMPQPAMPPVGGAGSYAGCEGATPQPGDAMHAAPTPAYPAWSPHPSTQPTQQRVTPCEPSAHGGYGAMMGPPGRDTARGRFDRSNSPQRSGAGTEGGSDNGGGCKRSSQSGSGSDTSSSSEGCSDSSSSSRPSYSGAGAVAGDRGGSRTADRDTVSQPLAHPPPPQLQQTQQAPPPSVQQHVSSGIVRQQPYQVQQYDSVAASRTNASQSVSIGPPTAPAAPQATHSLLPPPPFPPSTCDCPECRALAQAAAAGYGCAFMPPAQQAPAPAPVQAAAAPPPYQLPCDCAECRAAAAALAAHGAQYSTAPPPQPAAPPPPPSYSAPPAYPPCNCEECRHAAALLGVAQHLPPPQPAYAPAYPPPAQQQQQPPAQWARPAVSQPPLPPPPQQPPPPTQQQQQQQQDSGLLQPQVSLLGATLSAVLGSSSSAPQAGPPSQGGRPPLPPSYPGPPPSSALPCLCAACVAAAAMAATTPRPSSGGAPPPSVPGPSAGEPPVYNPYPYARVSYGSSGGYDDGSQRAPSYAPPPQPPSQPPPYAQAQAYTQGPPPQSRPPHSAPSSVGLAYPSPTHMPAVARPPIPYPGAPAPQPPPQYPPQHQQPAGSSHSHGSSPPHAQHSGAGAPPHGHHHHRHQGPHHFHIHHHHASRSGGSHPGSTPQPSMQPSAAQPQPQHSAPQHNAHYPPQGPPHQPQSHAGWPHGPPHALPQPTPQGSLNYAAPPPQPPHQPQPQYSYPQPPPAPPGPCYGAPPAGPQPPASYASASAWGAAASRAGVPYGAPSSGVPSAPAQPPQDAQQQHPTYGGPASWAQQPYPAPHSVAPGPDPHGPSSFATGYASVPAAAARPPPSAPPPGGPPPSYNPWPQPQPPPYGNPPPHQSQGPTGAYAGSAYGNPAPQPQSQAPSHPRAPSTQSPADATQAPTGSRGAPSDEDAMWAEDPLVSWHRRSGRRA